MATPSAVHYYLVTRHGLSEQGAYALMRRFPDDVANGMQFGRSDEEVGSLLLKFDNHECNGFCVKPKENA